jgi:hypothetical protein
MRSVALIVGIVMLMACQEGRSQPNDAEGKPAAAANQGKYYDVAVAPGELAVSEKGTVLVSLTPGEGYKWNEEYPAKFALTAGAEVTLDKADFSFKKKEIQVTKKAAQLAVPMAVAKVGKQEIEFKGSFSVCNDTSCKIMRNEVFTVTVEGK